MTKMSKFVQQLANYVRFEVNVRAKCKDDLEERLNDMRSEEAGIGLADPKDGIARASTLYNHTFDSLETTEHAGTLPMSKVASSVDKKKAQAEEVKLAKQKDKAPLRIATLLFEFLIERKLVAGG